MASAIISGTKYQVVRAQTNIFGANVLSVSWSSGTNPNIAEIAVPRKRIQEFRQYNAGKPVWVRFRRNFRSKTVFHGWITGRYLEFSPDSEMVSFIAQGPRWRMTGDFIKGRFQKKADDTFGVLSGLKAIFNDSAETGARNEQGKLTREPRNAALEAEDGQGIRPFARIPGGETAKLFTVNDCAWYIYKVGKESHGPDIVGDILTLTEFGIGETVGQLKPIDVDVDGLSITDAFATLFSRAGLHWWCKPVSKTRSELKATFSGPEAEFNAPKKYFYLADVARGVSPGSTPNLSRIDQRPNNTNAGRFNEDFSDTHNEVIAYGDRKAYQAALNFKPGWDVEAANKFLNETFIIVIRQDLKQETSSDWETYKDYGRKWILDEADDEAPYDLFPTFNTLDYAHRKRPLLGERLDGIEFEQPKAGNPNTTTLSSVTDANVTILENEAGIYIEGDELKPPLFVEDGATGFPRFADFMQMTVALKEDKALEKNANTSSAQDGFLVGVINEEEQIDRRLPLVLEDEYQTDNINADESAAVEAQLQEFADRKLLENKNPRASSSFSLPFISYAYEPGDVVFGVKGRDISFVAQVVDVRFSLDNTQTTEVVCEDLRLAEA